MRRARCLGYGTGTKELAVGSGAAAAHVLSPLAMVTAADDSPCLRYAAIRGVLEPGMCLHQRQLPSVCVTEVSIAPHQ